MLANCVIPTRHFGDLRIVGAKPFCDLGTEVGDPYENCCHEDSLVITGNGQIFLGIDEHIFYMG